MLKQQDAIQKRQDIESKNRRIRELLACESDLAFPDGVTLEDLLKALKSSTSSKDYHGIPIYVSPLGLQEVDKTLSSLVVVKRGDTRGQVLQEALRVLNLAYDVKDGFLTIDSRLSVVEAKLQRLEEKLDRIVNELEKSRSRP